MVSLVIPVTSSYCDSKDQNDRHSLYVDYSSPTWTGPWSLRTTGLCKLISLHWASCAGQFNMLYRNGHLTGPRKISWLYWSPHAGSQHHTFNCTHCKVALAHKAITTLHYGTQAWKTCWKKLYVWFLKCQKGLLSYSRHQHPVLSSFNKRLKFLTCSCS